MASFAVGCHWTLGKRGHIGTLRDNCCYFEADLFQIDAAFLEHTGSYASPFVDESQ